MVKMKYTRGVPMVCKIFKQSCLFNPQPQVQHVSTAANLTGEKSVVTAAVRLLLSCFLELFYLSKDFNKPTPPKWTGLKDIQTMKIVSPSHEKKP